MSASEELVRQSGNSSEVGISGSYIPETTSGCVDTIGAASETFPDYDWGPWRVVMSNKLARPFFFNTLTRIGQFDPPRELTIIPFDVVFNDDHGAVEVDTDYRAENEKSDELELSASFHRSSKFTGEQNTQNGNEDVLQNPISSDVNDSRSPGINTAVIYF